MPISIGGVGCVSDQYYCPGGKILTHGSNFPTQGTIEEKIVRLHHEKRDRADKLLEGTDQAPVKITLAAKLAGAVTCIRPVPASFGEYAYTPRLFGMIRGNDEKTCSSRGVWDQFVTSGVFALENHFVFPKMAAFLFTFSALCPCTAFVQWRGCNSSKGCPRWDRRACTFGTRRFWNRWNQ